MTLAQKAKNLLEPIPAEKWITDRYTNQKDSCCAIGHYMRLTSSTPNDYSFDVCSDGSERSCDLRKASWDFLGRAEGISAVNNGHVPKYPQSTPKERVMALLNDMIAAGY